MNAEISAKVEALYASGLVERPTRALLNGIGELHWHDGEQLWMFGDPKVFAVSCELPESVIGWSLVRACWTKGMVPYPRGCGGYTVGRDCGRALSTDPCAIAAMLAALNGGG
jgi:hypothetical protein